MFGIHYLHLADLSSGSPVRYYLSFSFQRPFYRLSAVSLLAVACVLMAFLFGATTADTPQFDRVEVADETSPLMGGKKRTYQIW